MKRLFSCITALLLLVSVFPITGVAASNTSSSVPQGYTAIYSVEDLDAVRQKPKGKYILMNDLDLSAIENWIPIGESEVKKAFSGIFDGNGHSITNLSINETDITNDVNLGLFGYTNGATIKNLNLSGKIRCATKASVGGIVGSADFTTISSCINDVVLELEIIAPRNNFMGNSVSAGGIVGQATECLISQCSNRGAIVRARRKSPIRGQLNQPISDQ